MTFFYLIFKICKYRSTCIVKQSRYLVRAQSECIGRADKQRQNVFIHLLRTELPLFPQMYCILFPTFFSLPVHSVLFVVRTFSLLPLYKVLVILNTLLNLLPTVSSLTGLAPPFPFSLLVKGTCFLFPMVLCSSLCLNTHLLIAFVISFFTGLWTLWRHDHAIFSSSLHSQCLA